MGVQSVEVLLLVFGFEEPGEEVAGDDFGERFGVCVFVEDYRRAFDPFDGRRRRHELGIGGFAHQRLR